MGSYPRCAPRSGRCEGRQGVLEGLTAASAARAPSLLIYMASCVVSVTTTTPRIVMATIVELPAGSYPPR